MKVALLLGFLASTSLVSARIRPGAHGLAVAASLLSGPLAVLAKPVWRYTPTRLNARDEASDFADQLASGESAVGTATATGTAPKSTASGCGGHHHHHHNSTGTTGSTTHAHNGTEHHSHNGTKADEHAHNSTLSAEGSGECNATTHHHHKNGTDATTTAASFFIPVTATASALAVALTSPAAVGNFVARAAGGFAAMLPWA